MLDDVFFERVIPAELVPLTERARYRAVFGGRGGAKSHFFGEQMIEEGFTETLRCVCIREVQNTIKDSVYALLCEKISKFGLEWFYDIREGEIRGRNGTLIIFRGMQAYNAENIKSLEAFDRAWVEEAQTLSAKSWRMLRPTMRKPGSEIWCSWNPRHDTDPVDMYFRGTHPPANATIIEVNWPANPWFFETEMVDELRGDFLRDPEMAEHIWNGGYELVSEGTYFARLVSQAQKQGRIGDFPYNPRLPVHTSWDIGVDDYTVIWFWQVDEEWATVIDFFETQDVGAEQIIAVALPELFIAPANEEDYAGWSQAEALARISRRPPGFQYGRHYLPHDIKNREWGSGGRSRVQIVAGFGVKPIHKGAAMNPDDRIAAARRLLPKTRFNNTARVQIGLKRLRRYKKRLLETNQMNVYVGPLKDENSHAADGFGEFAVNCPLAFPEMAPPQKPVEIDDFSLAFDENGRLQANIPTVKDMVEAKLRRSRQARI